MTVRILFFSIVSVVAITGCTVHQADDPSGPVINYYYWQARGSIEAEASSYLEESHSNKLYMRFFDVHYIEKDGQEGPFPISISQATVAQLPQSIELVPVVYIENDVFAKASDYDIEQLKGHVKEKIDELWSKKGLITEMVEVQIDCDWTESTKDRYFDFLHGMRQLGLTYISATIRLHQVKYTNTTGIPPVDYGVLMFYNMGEVTRLEESNSILNLEEAEKYLEGADAYPLPLVAAFPNFSWGVLFRKGEAIGLLNNTDLSLFESALFAKNENGKYQCLERCFIDGKWLYEDDLVRFETVSNELLKEAHTMVNSYVETRDEIIIYHLNTDLMNRSTPGELKAIFE